MKSELSTGILHGGDSNPDLGSPSDELSPDEPSAGHSQLPVSGTSCIYRLAFENNTNRSTLPVGKTKSSQPRPPAEHFIIQYYAKPRKMWCGTPAKRLQLPPWCSEHRSERSRSMIRYRVQLCVEHRLWVLAVCRASASSLLASSAFSSSFSRFRQPVQLPAFACSAWVTSLGVPQR